MTTEMSQATLPVMHINIGDISANYLYGYTEPMECATMRDTLTVIDDSRKVDFTIDTYGTKIRNASFEVRDITGERLIENTDIYNYVERDRTITGSISIKDLITKDEEYMLIFLLEDGEGTTVRYYTRLIWSDDVYAEEKAEFVNEFCTAAVKGDPSGELTKYMESDSTGDNSSYNYVNIHSSYKQVIWDGLDITMLGQPRVDICELTSATGYLKAQYQVKITEETGDATCNVTEYFRIRYTSDRVYLLDWERNCSQIFDEKGDNYIGNAIELGIADDDIEIKECDGGNIFAFVDEGKLISVNASEEKAVLIYSFYSEDLQDLRTSNMNHDIHILSVDESGNVIFAVCGYFNRGSHEGRVGLDVYEYDSSTNTIEEKAYVDYNCSASIFRDDISQLSYVDRDGKIYFMLERTVYEINTEKNTISVMAKDLKDDSYKVSDTGKSVAWQNSGEEYSCDRLRLMNLTTGLSEDIKAGYGEYIMPLGFMNEDLVYGLAHTKDVKQDLSGAIVFPMYKIVIRNELGDILKEYSPDGVYVTDCRIADGQMNLTRVVYDEESGLYQETSNDQIVSTTETVENNNKLNIVATDALESIVQINTKDEFTDSNITIQTPREVMYEGSRELIRETNEEQMYYVYGLEGYAASFLEAGNAVNYAYGISGLVVDEDGKYIWYKSSRVSKNQIMAITEPEVTDSAGSIAECIDAMLRLEGVTINSEVLISQGLSAQEILEEYLPEDRIVLNLTGCNLDVVLYYVNMDIPVFTVMNDGTAYLITGFNESEIVLYDPENGELRKENTTEADNMFMQNGYRFITYR